MRQFYFFCISLIIGVMQANAQCGNVSLLTQANVDNFTTAYPGCTTITNLYISGADITNLNALSGVTQVTNLHIQNVPALTNYSGLNNLTTITGNFQFNGTSAATVTALSGVTSVGGYLYLISTSNLTNFIGFNNLDSVVGTLYVNGNTALTALPSMTSLESVGTLTVTSNAALATLSGLNNLESVGAGITIGSNASLSSIAGLNSVTSMNGMLSINNNGSLTSLNGIGNIDPEGITSLQIYSSATLTTCDYPSICEFLSGGGSNYITGNGTGCANLTQINVSCGVPQNCQNVYLYSQTDVDNYPFNYGCSEITGTLYITGATVTNLDALSQITSVGGDLYLTSLPALTDVDGLNNLTSIGGQFQWSYGSDGSFTNLLNNVTSIGGNFYLYGLETTSFTGFSDLQTIGGYFNINGCASLTSVPDFPSLTSIGTYFQLYNNTLLNDSPAFNALTSLSQVTVAYNPQLTAIPGMNNVSGITSLNLYANALLATCDQDWVCNALSGGATGSIYSNATGCSSAFQILQACNPGCPPDHVNLYNQEDVDEFGTNYPSCTQISGDLYISGSDITDLTPLENITNVVGSVTIVYNYALTSLNGLQNLTTIHGNLNISGNSALTSVAALNVVTIDDNFTFQSNAAIANLNGLSELTTVGNSFSIASNSALTSVSGLSGLTNVPYLTISSNPALLNVDGLGSLGHLNTISVQYNDALTSISGLNGMEADNVTIRNNPVLTSVNGLGSLTNIASLNIEYNDALSGISGLSGLQSISGSLNVVGNTSLTSLTGLGNITSANYVYIYGNPALTSMEGLNSLQNVYSLQISQNAGLLNLNGLEALTNSEVTYPYVYLIGNESLASVDGLDALQKAYSFQIQENPALTDLSALSNLSVLNYLTIRENGALTTLAGLENMNSDYLYGLTLESSASLSTCDISPICNFLTNGGNATITGNAVGCNSSLDVQMNCDTGAQCPSGALIFNTQQQIDDFLVNYPSCTVLEHQVTISGDDIENVDGLTNITTSYHNFIIINNPLLTDLDGLDSLEAVGYEVRIENNPSLANLSGLSNLNSTGNTYIVNNDALTNLNGLESMQPLGLTIIGNQNLTSLTTFSLTTLGNGLNIAGNPSLTDLDGLESLTTCQGGINIQDNDALTSLTGLSNLTALTYYYASLNINNNEVLTSLNGLQNIDPTTFYTLYIYSNPNLNVCDLPNLCTFLSNNGSNYITGNATACASEENIQLACGNDEEPTFSAVSPSSVTACYNTWTTLTFTGLVPGSTNAIHYNVGGGSSTYFTVIADETGSGTANFYLSETYDDQTLTITSVERTDVATGTIAVSTNNTVTLALSEAITYYVDNDDDGYGYYWSSVSSCGTPPEGYVTNNTDCNDNDANLFQNTLLYVDADADGYTNGQQNVCQGVSIPAGYSETSLGQDCNDADALVNTNYQFYADTDGDGYGFGGLVSVCALDAVTPPSGYSSNNTDCAPSNPNTYQSATLYVDVDGDGYDNGSDIICYGASAPAGYSLTTLGEDCDDNNASAHTGQIYYVDADGDGYGTGGASNTCSDGSVPAGYSDNNTDCDDTNGSVFQSANVYIDNDQDGYNVGYINLCYGASLPAGYALTTSGSDCDDSDPDAFTGYAFYVDSDGDGYGYGPLQANVCASAADNPPTGYSTNNTDCDDDKPEVWTTFAFYTDNDLDGFGTGSLVQVCAANATTPPAGYSLNNTDCNDNDATSHETFAFYTDADGDGYGTGSLVQACAPDAATAPAGFSLVNTDCDDSNGSRHPGMTEYCGNGIDDDCDGLVDDEDPDSSGSQTYYADTDGDGYGNPAETLSSCNLPAGYVADNTDCDDADALEFPGQVWFIDADGDGYGSGESIVQCTRPTDGHTAAELAATSGDCNDSDASINPGAQRIEFSGSPNFTTSMIYPLTGSLYSSFTFEAIYYDANNALPPVTFPRVYLDYEGNGNYNGANDRAIIMTAADASDNNTADGKKYIGTINALAYGTNWKTSVEIAAGGCVTKLGPIDAPDVFMSPNIQLFANDITFSTNHPGTSSPLTVNATIHNESDFPAENFVVHLINQYDPSIVYGDITVPFIAPQGQTTVSWNITTPSVPAWCPMQVIIDYTNVISETNELDNSAVRPFINGNYNLIGGINVTAAASPSVSIISGNQWISVYGHAEYFGTPTPLLDPSVAGATVNITVTETGQTYSGHTDSAGNYTIVFLAPNTVGTYHVTGTITDYTFEAPLATEFSRIQVVTCPTDLILHNSSFSIQANTTLTGPYVPWNTIIAGESISGTIRTWSGCEDIPVASVTAVSQTGGLPEIADYEVPALAGGSVHEQDFSNIVFNTPGSYSICANANDTNTVTEEYYNNNSGCVTINVLPNLPDIAPSNGPSGSSYLCYTTGNTIGFGLFNHGGAATGSFDVDVIVSHNGNYQETLHHTVTNMLPLHYESFTLPFTFTDLGTYSFEIRADVPLPNGNVTEWNELNNGATYYWHILECKPDLTVQACESPDVLPQDPGFGNAVTYNAVVSNGGNATVAGPVEVSFVLSDGQSYTTNVAGPIAPGASVTVSVNGTSPATTGHTLVVTADSGGTVSEASEDNNTSSGSLCHDFQPVNQCGTNWPWGATVLKNSSTYLSIGLNQYGLYDASSVDVRFEVSGPGLSGTVNLGNATIENVEKNCWCPYHVALPYSFVFPEEGTYTFTMTVDPDNVYNECDETNNVIVRTVNVVNTPDMQVLSQHINPSLLNPEPGEEITMTVSYENLGLSNIDDTMTMQVFIDEVLHQTFFPVNGLGTGENNTLQVTVPWSSDEPGPHIIRTVIDSNNDIVEFNEMNNEATRAVVVGEAANFKFDSFASSNPTPAINEVVNLMAEIANQGDLDAEADLEFYYVANNYLEIPIGSLHISVPNNSSITVDYPWVVVDNSTTIKAKIINSNVLEFTYDDNEASTVIGGMALSFNSVAACTGGNNGTLTVTPSGGQAPYSYEWENGFNQATLTAGAGTYSVTVTDASGLTATASGSITEGGTGSTTYYADLDEDGYGDASNAMVACEPPAGYVTDDSDCDDNDATIYRNGDFYIDADGDGYDGGSVNICYGAETPAGYAETTQGQDCDDSNASVQTGYTFFVDSDGDGYGSAFTALVCTESGTPPLGYSLNDTDCDDDNTNIYQMANFFIDVDGDGYDAGTADVCYGFEVPEGYASSSSGQDCDDNDASAQVGYAFFEDYDGDGFGSTNSVLVCTLDSGTAPAGYSLNDTDCDDENADIWQTGSFYVDADADGYDAGTVEVCFGASAPAGYAQFTNGADCDDANPAAYQGYSFYVDADGDGYGAGDLTLVCAEASSPAPEGYSLDGTDCDDTNPAYHSGGELFVDSDGDGFTSGMAMVCFGSEIPDGYTDASSGEDCDDADPAIHGGYQFYFDNDGDGVGQAESGFACAPDANTPPAGFSLSNTDCDDNDASVYQFASLFIDADGDGYDAGTSEMCYGASIPSGYAETSSGQDCDDADASVQTGFTYYVDADGDGFGSEESTMLCGDESGTPPAGYADNSDDCDDTDASVNPSASEVLYNGIDDNCSGELDEGFQIVTQVIAAQCGITVAKINTTVLASPKPNATRYRFKAVNMETGEIGYVERTVSNFNMSLLSNFNYSASYMVSVEIQRNGIWLGYYGPACQINTPDVLQPGGGAQVNAIMCGTTLPTITTIISATNLNGVTGYRFRVTNLSNPEAPNQVQVLDRNLHWFNISMLPTYHYGTTYSVEVAVKGNGEYSQYGSACTITTPAVPAIASCGTHYTSANHLVTGVSLNKSNGYRFEISQLDSEGVVVSTVILDRTLHFFALNQISGLVPGAEYSIRMAVMTSGSYSPFGPACSIFAPAASRQSEPLEEEVYRVPFAVTVFPSPYVESFSLNLETGSEEDVNVAIYDMSGRLIEEHSYASSQVELKSFGERHAAGVYNVVVSQGQQTKSVRVIKK